MESRIRESLVCLTGRAKKKEDSRVRQRAQGDQAGTTGLLSARPAQRRSHRTGGLAKCRQLLGLALARNTRGEADTEN